MFHRVILGAIGLREALEEQFPKLQFVLDYSHLKGHVYETAEAIGLTDGSGSDGPASLPT